LKENAKKLVERSLKKVEEGKEKDGSSYSKIR
jgi:hypothetical protein